MGSKFRSLHVLAAAGVGGAEVHCRDLVRALRCQGSLDAHVCCLRPGDAGMLSSLENASRHCVHVCASGSSPARWRYLLGFTRACRRLRPQGLIIHFFGLDAMFLAVLAKLSGTRAVIVIAGNPAPSLHVSAHRSQARKWAFVLAALRFLRVPVVAPSRWIEASLLALGPLPRQSCVIPHGVPYRSVNAEASQGREARSDETSFVLGTIGRLEKIKDVSTSLRAIAQLKAASLDVTFRFEIVGDGPERSSLEMLSRALGISEDVQFLGMRHDARRLLGRWQAFVFSTTEDEGFGIVLIEALAAGVEVLASDVPACREVLRNGELGTLFRAGDHSALAALLMAVLDREQPGPPMPKGYELYDVSKCVESYSRLLRKLPPSA